MAHEIRSVQTWYSAHGQALTPAARAQIDERALDALYDEDDETLPADVNEMTRAAWTYGYRAPGSTWDGYRRQWLSTQSWYTPSGDELPADVLANVDRELLDRLYRGADTIHAQDVDTATWAAYTHGYASPALSRWDGYASTTLSRWDGFARRWRPAPPVQPPVPVPGPVVSATSRPIEPMPHELSDTPDGLEAYLARLASAALALARDADGLMRGLAHATAMVQSARSSTDAGAAARQPMVRSSTDAGAADRQPMVRSSTDAGAADRQPMVRSSTDAGAADRQPMVRSSTADGAELDGRWRCSSTAEGDDDATD